MKRILPLWAGMAFLYLSALSASSQSFRHPGIAQSREDLEFMKKMVKEGKEPWSQAFRNLQGELIKEPDLTPAAHVKRGPYGKPNIGADQLSRGAEKAYQWALYWYLTGDDTYAKKATELLMAWSDTLMDFDFNDAKLLAAWTGHKLCNAAEILRYEYPGWSASHTDRLSRMLMTVYYPLLRYYFPEANGNWDGAIVHSLMCIGIFTDNREIFHNAVNHYLYGSVNGSIFKYIYPSGQCQESRRDQGHVQLGLGEFAGAAHVAFTQGIDLFTVGGNRLALGFEYTAAFLNGNMPLCYGAISHRAIKKRDDFEYAVGHYNGKGIPMPHSLKILDSTRLTSSISVLSATRKPTEEKPDAVTLSSQSPFEALAGAIGQATADAPANSISVAPGQPLQDALNKAAGSNGWVLAEKGVHLLPTSLVIPSGVTLTGEGHETILFLDPKSGKRDALVNDDPRLKDVTIRDLVIEVGPQTEIHSDPNAIRSFRSQGNRGGIVFQTDRTGDIQNITLERITVRGATYNGGFLNGIENLIVRHCDFDECGSKAVPGPRIQHNLLLTHCRNVHIAQSRFSTSPFGSGLAIDKCRFVTVTESEFVRNACHGILITESEGILVKQSLIEGNDRSGILAEFLWDGSDRIAIENNTIHYNGNYGIESYACKEFSQTGNLLEGNRQATQLLSETTKRLIQP